MVPRMLESLHSYILYILLHSLTLLSNILDGTQWSLEATRSNISKSRYKGGNASLLLNNFMKPKSNNTRWSAIEQEV